MIMMTLKSRSPRPRFQVPAEGPRPIRPLLAGTPADRDTAAAAPADSTYLRRWIAHQAVTYTRLLETIAAAPDPHRKRD